MRVLTCLDHARTKCSLYNTEEPDLCLLEDFITKHTKNKGTVNTLLESLITMDPSFFSHVLCLSNAFYLTLLTHSLYKSLLYMSYNSLVLVYLYLYLSLLCVYLGLYPSGPIRHEHFHFHYALTVTINSRSYCV